MNQSKRWWEIAGIALGILLLVAVTRTLLKAQPPAMDTPPETVLALKTAADVTNTPQTAVETLTPLITAQTQTATVQVTQAATIPLCAFAASAPAEPANESLLNAYIFSEPHVVLTNELEFEIAQWLPDSRRLLIKRQASDQSSFEFIETLDVQTGEIQRYGETHYSSAEPVWLSEEHAVAYVDFNLNNQRALYISRGGSNVEEVIVDVAANHLASMVEGQKVIYFAATDRKSPQVFDPKQVQRMALHPRLLLPVEETPQLDYLAQYQIAIQPNGDQIAFYNNSGLYLADTNNGDTCEISLGKHSGRKQWAWSAHWSPNGRYLAVFVVIGDRPVPFTHLIVIDMRTGEQHPIDLGNDYLYTLTWAPNSRDFLLLDRDTEDEYRHNLQLVDAVSGQTRLMLEEYPFMYSAYHGVVWASNGQVIALSCPIVTQPGAQVVQRQLCIIPVEIER